MTIDAFASQSHYVDHIAPVMRALPDERRGTVYLGMNSYELGPVCTRHDLAWGTGRPPASSDPVLIAGGVDLVNNEGRPVVFVEHGAGQVYRHEDGSLVDTVAYTGGRGRDQVALFLASNQQVADANLARYPHAHAAVVGDATIQPVEWKRNDPPVVAVTFHWDAAGLGVPELRWTWPNWAWAMTQLAKEYDVVGTAHPKAQPFILPWWDQNGIMSTPRLDVIMQVADVLVADNTSAAVEFARTGRPILWLNARHYRRHVNHGGRFYDWESWAYTADDPEDDKALIEMVGKALADPLEMREARAVATEQIYPYIGDEAARRSADAILEFLC